MPALAVELIEMILEQQFMAADFADGELKSPNLFALLLVCRTWRNAVMNLNHSY